MRDLMDARRAVYVTTVWCKDIHQPMRERIFGGVGEFISYRLVLGCIYR